MEVFIYKGISHLPSIDFECLRVIAYIRLSNAPVKINNPNKSNPFKSPDGILPYFKCFDGTVLSGYNKIIEYLKKQGYLINRNVSEKDIGLSDAYIIHLFRNLCPYFLYTFWMDKQNTDVTRSIYALKTTFPFNFYYPTEYGKRAKQLLAVLENIPIDDDDDILPPIELLNNAKRLLNDMEIKVENKDHLLSNYNEIDATLYSYLAIIFNTKLPNNPLQMHIRECPNLIRYIERFRKKFLSDISTCSEPNPYKTSFDDSETNSNKLTKIFAGFFALFAMTSFAISQGILQFTQDKDELNYIEEYDEDIN